MVREIAIFRVQGGSEEDFIEAYSGVSDVLEQAEGSHGVTLHRGVENPNTFTLIVEWDSVEAHTNLTKQPEFEKFGEAVAPYLAGAPDVRHVKPVE
ncbi:hypothetical protein BH24ACT20_BH24ACT20_10090 [soil metagenome]